MPVNKPGLFKQSLHKDLQNHPDVKQAKLNNLAKTRNKTSQNLAASPNQFKQGTSGIRQFMKDRAAQQNAGTKHSEANRQNQTGASKNSNAGSQSLKAKLEQNKNYMGAKSWLDQNNRDAPKNSTPTKVKGTLANEQKTKITEELGKVKDILQQRRNASKS